MVSFSVDWDDFSLRLRVEAAPRVPRARRLRVEVGSGTGWTPKSSPSKVTSLAKTQAVRRFRVSCRELPLKFNPEKV